MATMADIATSAHAASVRRVHLTATLKQGRQLQEELSARAIQAMESPKVPAEVRSQFKTYPVAHPMSCSCQHGQSHVLGVKMLRVAALKVEGVADALSALKLESEQLVAELAGDAAKCASSLEEIQRSIAECKHSAEQQAAENVKLRATLLQQTDAAAADAQASQVAKEQMAALQSAVQTACVEVRSNMRGRRSVTPNARIADELHVLTQSLLYVRSGSWNKFKQAEMLPKTRPKAK